MLALKSVTQDYRPTPEIQRLLDMFRKMVNECIEVGLSCNVTALKSLSLLSWPRRRKYECPTYYKACAVSRAAGTLAARKKSLKRGMSTKNPYSIRPQITAYQGFKIGSRSLRIPVGNRKFQYVPLTRHSLSVLSDPAVKVRSFTITLRVSASASPKKFPTWNALKRLD